MPSEVQNATTHSAVAHSWSCPSSNDIARRVCRPNRLHQATTPHHTHLHGGPAAEKKGPLFHASARPCGHARRGWRPLPNATGACARRPTAQARRRAVRIRAFTRQKKVPPRRHSRPAPRAPKGEKFTRQQSRARCLLLFLTRSKVASLRAASGIVRNCTAAPRPTCAPCPEGRKIHEAAKPSAMPTPCS